MIHVKILELYLAMTILPCFIQTHISSFTYTQNAIKMSCVILVFPQTTFTLFSDFNSNSNFPY